MWPQDCIVSLLEVIVRKSSHARHGHGLGQPMGWVGLGQKCLDFGGLGEKSVPVIGNEIRQK
jgi:hypothetical protein